MKLDIDFSLTVVKLRKFQILYPNNSQYNKNTFVRAYLWERRDYMSL